MKKNKSAIYIALGANLSNPKKTFKQSIAALRQMNVKIRNVSGLWQSPAWPEGNGQPDYINACAEVEFLGHALELLQILHRVEFDFGRVRGAKNAARTLDLDLVDFKGEIMSNERITLPHARMLSRGFVLLPLSQIAPQWSDPHSNLPIWHHIAKLPSQHVLSMQYLHAL